MKKRTNNEELLDALDRRIRALHQEARDTEIAKLYVEGVLKASVVVRVSGESLRMTNPELHKKIRDELDRLYKNWVVLNGRVGRLIEEGRTSSSMDQETFRAVYSEWKLAGSYSSFYGDHIARALRSIDPEWSQAWANHAALLVLDPEGTHSPPVIGPGARPSNAF